MAGLGQFKTQKNIYIFLIAYFYCHYFYPSSVQIILVLELAVLCVL